jgi:hypothetical protein
VEAESARLEYSNEELRSSQYMSNSKRSYFRDTGSDRGVVRRRIVKCSRGSERSTAERRSLQADC